MADPVQIRAKEKRLAEALRANLKRRKDLARERAASEAEPKPSAEGGSIEIETSCALPPKTGPR